MKTHKLNLLNVSKIILLICLLLVIGFKIAFADTYIELKKNVTLSNKDVLLGKIASISGDNTNLTEQLKYIKVGNAPFPGKIIRVSVSTIKLYLKTNKINLDKIIIRGANYCVVKTQGIFISREKIFNLSKEYLLANIPWQKKDVIIEETRKIPSFEVSKGKIKFIVNPLSKSLKPGRISLIVTVYIDKIPRKTVQLSLNLRVFANVVCAKRFIERKEYLSLENVDIQRREITLLSNDIIYNFKDAITGVAKVNIGIGQVLTKRVVNIPPLVLKGAFVKIFIETPYMEASNKGIASQNGIKGDLIKIKTIDSNKELIAKVVGKNLVQIAF